MRSLMDDKESFVVDAGVLSLREMSEKYKMKECTVSKWKAKFGLSRHVECPSKEILSKDLESNTNVELAKKYGVGVDVISDWRKKSGLANIWTSQTWDVEKFKKDSVELRWFDMCNKYNISHSDLKYWKKKYGLTTGKKEDRKITYVKLTNGCWSCTSHGLDSRGYAQCRNQRLVVIRLWEEKNGSWPKGVVCTHSCDNSACVNPDHVSPETMVENQGGMAERHRSPWGWRSGVRKLSPEQAKEIYSLKDKGSAGDVARRFGVSKTTIWCIWNRKTWWRDVDGIENFSARLTDNVGWSGMVKRG